MLNSPHVPGLLQHLLPALLGSRGNIWDPLGGYFTLLQRSTARSVCLNTFFIFSEPTFSFLLNAEICWHGTWQAVPPLPPPASTSPLEPFEVFNIP